MDLVVATGLLLLGAASVVVVHEAAHVLAAKLVGARILGVRGKERGRVAPRVEVELVRPGAARAAVFFVAGPLANVAAAVTLVLTYDAFAASSAIALLVGLLHALFGLANLVPAGDSDGAQLLRSLRGR